MNTIINFGFSEKKHWISDDLDKNIKCFVQSLKHSGPYVFLKQIHSNKIFTDQNIDLNKTEQGCADGFVTNQKNLLVVVKTADCLPVLLHDKKQSVIAAIHAGWRGLENKIISHAIKIMTKVYKSIPINISAELGPCICSNCYEIQKDLVETFNYHPQAIIRKDGRTFLDLKELARNELNSNGIENISNFKICTYCNNLFSYRKDKTTKRIFAGISLY